MESPEDNSGPSDNSELAEESVKIKGSQASLRVLYFCSFIASAGPVLGVSSIWPYLQQVQPGVKDDFLGWAVAVCAMASLLMYPISAVWIHYGKFKPIIMISLVMSLLSSIAYSLTEDFPVAPKYFILGTRIVLGFGSGSLPVIMAYTTQATTPQDRTSTQAKVVAGQTIGFVVGPAIQAVVALAVGYPGWVHVVGCRLNIYTIPHVMFAAMVVVCIILMQVLFKAQPGEIVRTGQEMEIGQSEQKKEENDEGGNNPIKCSDASQPTPPKPTNIDYVAAIFIILSNLLMTFVLSAGETLMTPVLMHQYSLSREDATMYSGIILAVIAVLAICGLLLLGPLAKRFSERNIHFVAMLMMLAAYVLLLPWGEDYLIKETPSDNSTGVGQRLGKPPSALDTLNNTSMNRTMEVLGCPPVFTWCTFIPRLPLPQLIASCVFVAFGYSQGQGSLFGLLSKIYGPHSQTVGITAAFVLGGIGRLTGPIFLGYVYPAYGLRVTAGSVCGTLLTYITLYLVLFKRIVPNCENGGANQLNPSQSNDRLRY